MTTNRIIAHRGFAEQYPENTIYAVTESAQYVNMVEIDVRQCATGDLVVFHDETVDRLTGATGAVIEKSLSQLRALDVADSGESIPTLPEMLATLPDRTRVNLELKTTDTDAIARVIELCERHDTDVLYSSFYDGVIRTIRKFRPQAPIAVLAHHQQVISDRLVVAEDVGAVAFHPSFTLVNDWNGTSTEAVSNTESVDVPVDIRGGDVTVGADIVALAQELGLQVNVWVAPDREAVNMLFNRGVDGVMVDHFDYVPESMNPN